MHTHSRTGRLAIAIILGLTLGSPALPPAGQATGRALAPAARTREEASRAAQRHALSVYSNLALPFEVNLGQTDARVRYLMRGRGHTLFLTAQEAVLVLLRARESRKAATVVRTRFVGAQPAPQMTGQDRLPGVVNYFLGSDPRHWRTRIPTYARVRYRALYPGIDLVYHGAEGQLEYDFIVAPGADPEVIALEIQGANRLEIAADGDLVLHVPGGQLRHRKPHVYQERPGGRQTVAGAFVLRGPTRVGFRLGAYQSSRPVVIDPALTYSTYLGGNNSDLARGIAVDSAGNAYITGETFSPNFPTTAPFQPANGGGSDVFITKINASGSARIYSTYLGGSGNDIGYGIAVDGAGQAYVTGETASPNFPTTAPFQPANGGGLDAFITKVDASGSARVYSTYLGGSGDDTGYGIAVDGAGQAYVTGETASTNFPTTAPFQAANGGLTDAFITKVNASGSGRVYSTYLGGSSDERGRGIAADGMGQAYVTGHTFSTNFPTTAPFQPAKAGSQDVFITKVDASGTARVYSTHLGGSDGDFGYGIAVDTAGQAYVTGRTFSADFPTTVPFQPVYGGGVDAFVTKVNASGSGRVYSTFLGGSNFEGGNGIAVDGTGNAYVVGQTLSTNFPTTAPFQPANAGLHDAFITKVNPSGSARIYSTYLGGSGEDIGFGIAVNGAGYAYVTGQTVSTNFPTTLPFQPASGGSSDAFIAKIGPSVNVGLYDPAASFFFLRNSNTAGPADIVFGYGPAGAGWIPLAGDWNGDGIETVGLYNPASSTFFLRNSNTAGPADIAFGYGPAGAGWIPVVGDWNGDGIDTVGLYHPASSAFFLRNSNTGGPADLAFGYGPAGAGWTPVVGDWDGNGTATIGLHNPATSTFFLKNTNTGGAADLVFGYGPAGAGWIPIAGDWNGDRADTVGLYSPASSIFFLRNTNSAGPADVPAFPYGPAGAGWAPRAGNWDGN